MNDQLFNVLNRLIVKNNIHINKDELKLQLSSHPSYPSLHAVTGVLDHFRIPNLALRLSITQEIFDQLPDYFIANISTDAVSELVLIEKRKSDINIVSDMRNSKTVSQDQFLAQWDGIIVAIEKDESIQETPMNLFGQAMVWTSIALCVLIIGYYSISYFSLFALSHFILSIIGLVFSVFIVRHELGLQSAAENSFCHLSENTSCDTVLNSDGATVFEIVKLSDASIVTFACYSLYWLLCLAAGATNQAIIYMITLTAIPFIVYSLYIQYYVVKKWCPLCLGIAAVLILQILVVFFDVRSIYNSFHSLNPLLFLLFSFFMTISIWSLIKSLLVKKKDLENLEIEHYKFKRNFSVFKAVYDRGDALKSYSSVAGEIVFGKNDAPLELLIVTNPMCHYCKEAHRDAMALLEKSPDKIKVIIRFNVDIEHPESEIYKITSRLLHIYNIEGVTPCHDTLDEVFGENTNLKLWLQDQPGQSDMSYYSILKEQSEWCADNGINFTPAVYLNRKRYPIEYDINNIEDFMDDLIEQNQMSDVDVHQEILT